MMFMMVTNLQWLKRTSLAIVIDTISFDLIYAVFYSGINNSDNKYNNVYF